MLLTYHPAGIERMQKNKWLCGMNLEESQSACFLTVTPLISVFGNM